MKRLPHLLAGAVALLLALPHLSSAESASDDFTTLVRRDWGDAVIRVNLEQAGPVTFALESGEVSGLNHFARQHADFRVKGRKKSVLRGAEDAVSTVTGQTPKLLPRSVPALAPVAAEMAGPRRQARDQRGSRSVRLRSQMGRRHPPMRTAFR
jgi:hypothetical protein